MKKSTNSLSQYVTKPCSPSLQFFVSDPPRGLGQTSKKGSRQPTSVEPLVNHHHHQQQQELVAFGCDAAGC
ncbi:uncharacterized protein BO66DRAFT_125835 [Aspergillus aculeatinus CBS 121060]|uniref:Uncharacterized protein n=1 Tax=Aspergillus aculeatinus CBS 121060 TaxID=1448322 RepID=A0ACD1H4D6_9EURO|nr:hypothetical protein BO66DRAFT_125835 [Aspergillus aculeatinus CBS 121060]RAH68443.1 hypothetical protein BO66DRAFT_125835 [Aspergillus aculeatinus CBS 121060]